MLAARQRFIQGSQRAAATGFTAGDANVRIVSSPSITTNQGSLDISTNSATNVLSIPQDIVPPVNGQFTIEGWVYPTVKNNNFPQVFGRDNAGGGFLAGDWGVYAAHNSYANKWSWFHGFYNTSGASLVSTSTVSYNTWTHVAVSRDSSNVCRLFINGVSEANRTTSVNLDGTLDDSIHFGAVTTTNIASKFCGYIGVFRFSKNCRYTGNFTPPIEYINDPDTVLLCQFSGGPTNFLDDNT